MRRPSLRSWRLLGPVLLVALPTAGEPPAPAPPPSAWPRALGGAGREVATGIAVSEKGISWVIGWFHGNSSFGSVALPGAGQTDVFVAKVDREGQLLWARAFGGPGEDEGRAIAIAPNGDLLATGSFSGTADFDPGTGRSDLVSAGATDVFLLRLTAEGDLVWARRLGGPLGDAGLRVAAGANGEAFVAGSFQGRLTDQLAGAGKGDAFVARFDAAGELSWARGIGGPRDDEARGVAAARNGEVWVAGNFEGTAGLGSEGSLTSAGGGDVFLLKLDAAGNLLFYGRMGGPGEDAVESAAAAGAGGVALAGRFSLTADLDPGPGPLSLAAAGKSSSDAFVARVEGTGRLAWARQFGGNGKDLGLGVAANRAGTVVATGHFGGADNAAWVAEHAPNGERLWSLGLRSSGGLDALAVGIDGNETAYVAGGFQGETERVLETGAEPVKAAGSSDAFVWRIVPRGEMRPRRP